MVSKGFQAMLARVSRQNHLLEVAPRCPELLQILQSVEHRPLATEGEPFRVLTQATKLFEDYGEHSIRCWAGLEHVIGTVLKRAGHEVCWVGKRPAPLGKPA